MFKVGDIVYQKKSGARYRVLASNEVVTKGEIVYLKPDSLFRDILEVSQINYIFTNSLTKEARHHPLTSIFKQ